MPYKLKEKLDINSLFNGDSAGWTTFDIYLRFVNVEFLEWIFEVLSVLVKNESNKLFLQAILSTIKFLHYKKKVLVEENGKEHFLP